MGSPLILGMGVRWGQSSHLRGSVGSITVFFCFYMGVGGEWEGVCEEIGGWMFIYIVKAEIIIHPAMK